MVFKILFGTCLLVFCIRHWPTTSISVLQSKYSAKELILTQKPWSIVVRFLYKPKKKVGQTRLFDKYENIYTMICKHNAKYIQLKRKLNHTIKSTQT